MTTTSTTPTEPDTTSTAAIEQIVDAYIEVWNEPDAARRAELTEASLGDDLWYRDPMLEVDGREAFDATIAAVQQQLPGHVMTRTSGIDAHHDVVRFNWALGVPGEPPAYAGVDMAKLDADGKLHRIVGFAGESIPV